MAKTNETKKILFYCAVGDNHIAVSTWLLTAAKLGDIAIACYGDVPLPMEFAEYVKYQIREKGFKIPLFLAIVKANPDIIRLYDAFVFVDDDLSFESDEFEKFIDTCTSEKLDLAQPSLDHLSEVNWPHTRQLASRKFMQSDFVEVQCFYVTRRALNSVRDALSLVTTGYGLDCALLCEVHSQKFKAGVVHSAKMHHPSRPLKNSSVRKKYPQFDSKRLEIDQFLLDKYLFVVDLDLMGTLSYHMHRLNRRDIEFYRPYFPVIRSLRPVTRFFRAWFNRKFDHA